MQATGLHSLWPTPVGIYRMPQADDVNPTLARALQAMRHASTALQGQGKAAPDAPPAPFFASDDDLLNRLQLPEGRAVVQFIVESLKQTIGQANAVAWASASSGQLDMQIALRGLWFQISNRGAFHDVHTHGNCSWSGVYMVQVDAQAQRCLHPTYGAHNGVTRFYGPPFAHLGGAHVDLGNAYLQSPHFDVPPLPGQLVVFPSWLPHQAMPYEGGQDRVIISFNASVHAAGRTDQLHGYAAR